MTSYSCIVTKDIKFLVMAFDAHQSGLCRSSGLRYHYILPKPCRNVEDRTILADIKNVLPLDEHLKDVSCTASLSNLSSLQEQEAISDQRPKQQSGYDMFKYKLSKEDDKGFLLFIITHGRQLATRMPHLSEMGTLKTFKMLWSKMTPEHKSWYYNNENIIQNASTRDCDITAPTHQDIGLSVTNPCSSTSESNFHYSEEDSAIRQFNKRKIRRKINRVHVADHLDKRYQTFGKVYQIPRPVRSRPFAANNPPGASILHGNQWNYTKGPLDQYTADTNSDNDIQECKRAVDGIITEMGDQHNISLTSYDELKLLPSLDTNTIKQEKMFEDYDIEMQNESSEISQPSRDNLTADQVAHVSTPQSLNTSSQYVQNEEKPSGSHELTDEAVDTDGDREFVMIPCDVQIAKLLGWPVDLLPRVSQGYLDRFKVKCNT